MADYPSDELLERIRVSDDHHEVLELAREHWSYPERVVVDDGIYYFSTGGWSGNEDLIGAMMENRIFWAMHWQVSARGGHYWFRSDSKMTEIKVTIDLVE